MEEKELKKAKENQKKKDKKKYVPPSLSSLVLFTDTFGS